MEKAKIIIAALLGGFATFFGKYGTIFLMVAVIIVLDFLTGLVKAKIIGEKWDSKKGTMGFFKKISLLLALVFGVFLDWFLPMALQTGINFTIPFALPFALIIGVYIIVNESISICENLYQCNEKIIPKWIAKLLKIASETLDKGEKKQ